MYRNVFIKIIQVILKKINNFNDKIFFKKIIKLPCIDYLSIIDIGSSYDIEPRWKKIKKILKYYGFEPNIKLADELKSQNNDCYSYNIYPFLVSDKEGEEELNITKHPGVSSIFKPNFKYLSKFSNSKRYEVERSIKIKSNLIDNLNLQNIDFMKIDIQGGELKALIGSKETLKSVIGIEIEVEFQQIYNDQPLYGEINKYICEQKLDFIDFILINRWERDTFNSYGQACFADALYLRSPEYANELFDKRKMINYIIILILYNRYDLIQKCNLENLFNTNEILIINKTIKYFKYKNKIARCFSSFSTGFSRLLGNEYKSHLFN